MGVRDCDLGSRVAIYKMLMTWKILNFCLIIFLISLCLDIMAFVTAFVLLSYLKSIISH